MDNKQRVKDIFKAEKLSRIENSKYYLKKAKEAISLEERKKFDDMAWTEGVKLPAYLTDLEKRILKDII